LQDQQEFGIRAGQSGRSHHDILGRITQCEVQDAVHATKIRSLEERIATLVNASEFLPVKMAVYGIIGTALITVLSALVAGVIGVTPHLVGR
jgi:hypothetical protein